MTDNGTLHVERVVAATQARVWEAWTSAEGLAAWWWSHWADTTYAVELRPGGTYLIESPSHGVGVTGEFVGIEEPERLEMTWVWLDDGEPGPVEHVSVTFTAQDSAHTRISIVHTGPWATPEPAENYTTGWSFTLDQLEAACASPTEARISPEALVSTPPRRVRD